MSIIVARPAVSASSISNNFIFTYFLALINQNYPNMVLLLLSLLALLNADITGVGSHIHGENPTGGYIIAALLL